MGNLTCHMVLYGDLNHHGTLFAGQMTRWMVEACLIEAGKFVGSADDLVCVSIGDFTFKKPVQKAEIVEISTRVSRTGRTSLTVVGEVRTTANGPEPILVTTVSFVTVDGAGRPAPHGLSL